MNMKKVLMGLFVGAMLSGAGGCAVVTSSMPSASNLTGDVWYTEGTGIMGYAFKTRVFYCPAATAPGPATCKQAKMVSLTPADLDAEKAADKANDEASK